MKKTVTYHSNLPNTGHNIALTETETNKTLNIKHGNTMIFVPPSFNVFIVYCGLDCSPEQYLEQPILPSNSEDIIFYNNVSNKIKDNYWKNTRWHFNLFVLLECGFEVEIRISQGVLGIGQTFFTSGFLKSVPHTWNATYKSKGFEHMELSRCFSLVYPILKFLHGSCTMLIRVKSSVLNTLLHQKMYWESFITVTKCWHMRLIWHLD